MLEKGSHSPDLWAQSVGRGTGRVHTLNLDAAFQNEAVSC